MRCIPVLLLLMRASAAQASDICNPATLSGPYAFLLSGQTTISGTSQPAVSLGRITFDGGGKITGTSSIKFSGLLLGNPVTGTYEAKPDCTVTWRLQDDSGAYQHFGGKYTPDGNRVQFRQTDPGGITGGAMQKTPDSCTGADLKRQYSVTVSGKTKGVIDTTRDGDFQVDSDCAVHFTLTLPDTPPMTMRGFLVNGGKEILAFQTDPGVIVSARFTGLP